MLKLIISGKGGQGIQFIAQLLAKTAISHSMNVTMQKSYGPEARGGASQASVVINEKPITNPVIKQSDYLIAFTKEAVETWGSKSKKVIYNDNANNLFMLGKLLKEIKLFSVDDVIQILRSEISEKYIGRLQDNIDQLKKGFES